MKIPYIGGYFEEKKLTRNNLMLNICSSFSSSKAKQAQAKVDKNIIEEMKARKIALSKDLNRQFPSISTSASSGSHSGTSSRKSEPTISRDLRAGHHLYQPTGVPGILY